MNRGKETDRYRGRTFKGRATEAESKEKKERKRAMDGCTADSPKSQHASVPAPVC